MPPGRQCRCDAPRAPLHVGAHECGYTRKHVLQPCQLFWGRKGSPNFHLPRQDGGISVWRRQPGALTYTLVSSHKLTPPPSRLNSNAGLQLHSLAASLWRPMRSDLTRDAVLPVARRTYTEAPDLLSGDSLAGANGAEVADSDGKENSAARANSAAEPAPGALVARSVLLMYPLWIMILRRGVQHPAGQLSLFTSLC